MKVQTIEDIINIGLMLSSEMDIEKLFSKILSVSREVSNADAGSLYLKEGDSLLFITSQNETLEKKFKVESNKLFKPSPLKLSKTNIAGYVALTGEVLNIDDVYEIKDVPYKFYDSFDKKYEYRSRSMLVLPLISNDGLVIGVLQLINAKSKKNIIKFNEENIKVLRTLASFASIALKNALLAKSIKDAHLSTIYRLVNAAEYKDPDTAHHLERMSNYSKMIAKYLGYDEKFQELILYASPMHDIGKIGIPDSILGKPAALTEDERRVMEKHTVFGADILKNPDSDFLTIANKIAMSHHERWDGMGYPNHLKGEEIPIEGRITSLADVFDALSMKRVYKGSWPIEKVLDYIRENKGKQFCPYVVDAFFKGIDEIMEVYEKFKE